MASCNQLITWLRPRLAASMHSRFSPPPHTFTHAGNAPRFDGARLRPREGVDTHPRFLDERIRQICHDEDVRNEEDNAENLNGSWEGVNKVEGVQVVGRVVPRPQDNF
eukprot:366408-Chlamydomonas_euryale.AAC.2